MRYNKSETRIINNAIKMADEVKNTMNVHSPGISRNT